MTDFAFSFLISPLPTDGSNLASHNVKCLSIRNRIDFSIRRINREKQNTQEQIVVWFLKVLGTSSSSTHGHAKNIIQQLSHRNKSPDQCQFSCLTKLYEFYHTSQVLLPKHPLLQNNYREFNSQFQKHQAFGIGCFSITASISIPQLQK
jgi:hypothetical protein